ncbi:unnamed protein product [Jaminaea pallidilutea]
MSSAQTLDFPHHLTSYQRTILVAQGAANGSWTPPQAFSTTSQQILSRPTSSEQTRRRHRHHHPDAGHSLLDVQTRSLPPRILTLACIRCLRRPPSPFAVVIILAAAIITTIAITTSTAIISSHATFAADMTVTQTMQRTSWRADYVRLPIAIGLDLSLDTDMHTDLDTHLDTDSDLDLDMDTDAILDMDREELGYGYGYGAGHDPRSPSPAISSSWASTSASLIGSSIITAYRYQACIISVTTQRSSPVEYHSRRLEVPSSIGTG